MRQSEHKKLHKSQSNILEAIFTPKVVSHPDPATGHYNPFPTFPFTGSLRPVYPLSARREVPSKIQLPDYAEKGIPRSEQVFVGRNKITILNAAEQEAMRKVCRLAREVLDIAARAAKPGVTTDYIDEVVHNACLEREVSQAQYMSPDGSNGSLRTVLPIALELLPLPQVSMYVAERGHLPWHTRSTSAQRR
jgi:methionyl aminopeptidase